MNTIKPPIPLLLVPVSLRWASSVLRAAFLGSTAAVAQPTPLYAPAYGATQPRTGGVMAKALPAPPVPSDSPPLAFLEAARTALGEGRPGATQEALERAEARLLTRSADPAAAGQPDTQRAVLDIGVARQALAARNHADAARAIDDAIVAAARPPAPSPVAPPLTVAAQAAPLVSPPAPPPVTYALLPGHWQLRGANYVWVPPERTLRRVEERPFVLGAYVWRGGAWHWEAAHYVD